MNRERELKYVAQSSEPPRLPRGWSLGPERTIVEIVDTYLDRAATLITRGWALRRRETVGAPTRYTLKRNAQQVGAFHQRDEIEREGDQIPAEIVHEIGTQLPHEVWIALPEGSQTPALSYPSLRVTRLRGTAYTDGIQTVTDRGAPIRVYSAAKTVTDCFKFRNKIGLDVALEALKDAWRSRKVTMAELGHFAKINRVERVMQPYLEAMIQ